MISTIARRPMRFLRLSVLLWTVAASAAVAEEVGVGEGEEVARLIRAEPSITRTVLATPYTLFSLTAWPLEWAVDAMEATAFPNRVADVFLFPVTVFDDEEKDE